MRSSEEGAGEIFLLVSLPFRLVEDSDFRGSKNVNTSDDSDPARGPQFSCGGMAPSQYTRKYRLKYREYTRKYREYTRKYREYTRSSGNTQKGTGSTQESTGSTQEIGVHKKVQGVHKKVQGVHKKVQGGKVQGVHRVARPGRPLSTRSTEAQKAHREAHKKAQE
ncbi:hypothetical protein AVEN_21237-1 [Araneus ventricosus]|uniref:Uncharacterized protein n=1 Tax=Araneus ventricosus TaxID=182803 RepID=A0A4Y2GGS7_ARAVE|nr:hypothetical protein AVEN_21237-1 [Araneus ventricosus]